VEVEGVKVSKSSSTWSLLNSGTNKGVEFSNDYTIFPGQEVKIYYFVSSGVSTLLASKESAQAKINSHCACDPDEPCNLKPVYSSSEPTKLINYTCFYEQPDAPSVPLQTSVYISAKTMPHKFYDTHGTYYPAE